MSVAAIVNRVRRLERLQRETTRARILKRPPQAVPTEVLKEEADELPLARYYDDPVGFFREVLGLRTWSRQEEILRAAARFLRVAVRSGHKIGKSTSAVGIALWFFATRPRALVVLTAPKFDQIKKIVWKELRRVCKLVSPLGGRVGDVLGVWPALDPATGMMSTDDRWITGATSDTTEGMGGFSSPNLLVIADEASGIADQIFEAVEGNLSSGGTLILFGNPTKASGVFFEAFHARREFWCTIHVSSEETPNASGVGEPIPGLATREYIERKRREWGSDSPVFQVRIAGNFAGQASNAVIGLTLVEGALKGWLTSANDNSGDELHLGVDVARFGDDESVVAGRRGRRAAIVGVHQGMDGVEVANLVLAVAKDQRRGGETVTVKIDTTGGYGAAPYDILKARIRESKPDLDWLRLVEVNASARADDEEQYTNLRAQVWFGIAQWLLDGGTLAADSKLEAELLAATYRFDARGRRQVEPKDEMKKRLDGRSPDRADALGLAVYAGGKKHRRFNGVVVPGRAA